MSMSKKGLIKLIEECSELSVIAAKKCAYMNQDIHPDGQNMKESLEEEIADSMATHTFVIEKFNLDLDKILIRRKMKLDLYREWDKEYGFVYYFINILNKLKGKFRNVRFNRIS
jgi:NTP pyrophosphatase (non-canonical NTP hydrolase)